ncbi:MAG: hypothetical protein R2813_02970 [Flavobacteriales bacterium]
MNRQRTARILAIVSSLAIVVITGFIREFTFVNINEQLAYLYYDHDVSGMSQILGFLDGLSYNQLYWFKWILTPAFAAVFWLETMHCLKQLFGDYSFKEVSFLFIVLFSAAIILFGSLWILDSAANGYTQALFIMHLAQSPFPLMLLIPAMLLKGQKINI